MSRRLDIHVDESLCVGNGACLAAAPGVFAHDSARQSRVVDPTAGHEAAVLDAAANCPVGAITVADRDTGERLFPA